MFHSARIKLTTWYSLIIMLISVIFSLVIYAIVTTELERSLRRAEIRFRGAELNIPASRQRLWHPENMSPLLVADLESAKQRVVLNLLVVNGAILIISAGAGYFLAGKTLKPIETAMEEQKRFVADASHELRTPLTALKTSIEVALRAKKMSVKEAKSILASSLDDIGGLESLANNLLGLTQYQQENSALTFEPTKISQVVQGVFKKILPLAKQKDIEIKLNVPDQVLSASQRSLAEMMFIFLDNAVKYTPQGGQITVTTKTDKKNLVIEVVDTGVGIPQEAIPHIFDRFYRVDQSRSKDKVAGFGLGLSLAKKIIELHRGSVEVNSILGKGTTFRIKLPLKHS